MAPITRLQTAPAVQAAARLREALERTADAFAMPELDAILACEAAIEQALTDLPPVDSLDEAERAAVRAELDNARAALLRCRRLGVSLSEFVRLSFEAQGRGGLYGQPMAAFAGHALDKRA
jgi:hypothetical protein